MVTKGRQNFSSLSYYESNLFLIARKIMRLLVNHQLIPKRCKLKELHCILFFFRRRKTKTKNESQKSYQCSVSIEFYLDLNF